MRKFFAAVLSAAAAWMLLIAMLLAGVFICTTSKAFYEHEYDKYDNAATIGVTDETLMEITDGLLDYLWGRRENLDMQAEINGEMREVFLSGISYLRQAKCRKSYFILLIILLRV